MRKLVVMLIIALLAPQLVFAAVSQDIKIDDKLSFTEKLLYGSEQTGGLIERVAKLEKELYGKESKEALLTRVDRMYSSLRENSAGEPSFITNLNSVEWALAHNISMQPIKVRLEALELMLFSKNQQGSYETRLAQIMQTAFSTGRTELTAAKVAKDTLVRIRLLSDLSSKINHVDDLMLFEVSDNVIVDGQLVIAKEATGQSHILKIEQAKNFGRDAKMEISFDSVEAIDGSAVGVVLGDKAKEETKSLVTAAGASVAGMAILGPIGIIGGAFVHGKEVTIKAGTELYVQTRADAEVYGVKAK